MPRTRKPTTELNIPAFRATFYDFADRVTIVSKDTGRGPFRMFKVQDRLFDGLFDGLHKGIHSFVTLKARQLGSTTGHLLLDVFWPAMFPGLQGGIVFDTDTNKEKIRLLLTDVLENLPESHRLPVIVDNRNGLVFDTPGGTSMMDYLVAGTKKKSGNLGRSRALNYCHMTEVSSYGDEEGFESLKNTFSETFPYRLYSQESTARGFNLFYDEWEDAGDDTLTKKQIFLAWWMHENYQYERDTELFKRYGYIELSRDEKEIDKCVLEQFDYHITREQWAWYRHRKDPRARGDVETAREDKEELVEQEYPSYPEQAFISTGNPFISGSYLTPLMRKAQNTMFRGFRYNFGDKVTTTTREPVDFARQAQLKVFQEPVAGAAYIVAADPAFASSDTSDRYCCQVIRCYADRVEQVAVYCERNVESYQFTWVIIDLCAYYGDCRYILEIQGPGQAVYSEFRHLKTMIENGLLNEPRVDRDNPTEEELAGERRTRSMLTRVRQYLYKRPDSLAGGYNIHWVTTTSNKSAFMIQYRDRIVLNEISIVDVDTIRETQSLRQEGMAIAAEGKKKDDRPVALALAVRAWIDQERNGLVASGSTYERETTKDTEEGGARLVGNYITNLWSGAIADKAYNRTRRQRQEKKQRWSW